MPTNKSVSIHIDGPKAKKHYIPIIQLTFQNEPTVFPLLRIAPNFPDFFFLQPSLSIRDIFGISYILQYNDILKVGESFPIYAIIFTQPFEGSSGISIFSYTNKSKQVLIMMKTILYLQGIVLTVNSMSLDKCV